MAGETPYRPQLWHQLAFNADPNDPFGVPIWNDYTSLVRKIGTSKRGRTYELAQSVAAEPVFTWRDPSEIFNPANTSSPQSPNVEPYRQVCSQAMWPNPPVAGQPNLINSGRWKANNAVAPDPSFESYANGATLPGWLAAVGATVPTITTTNPQQGTKSLTYAVASSSTQQGVSWEADCVPGQQYTTSAYVRQSTASTQRLTVGGQTLLYDFFTRSASSSWGTSTSGAAWTNSGGSASDFSVSSNKGNHSNATTNVLRTSLADSGGDDVNVVAFSALPVTPAGASITRWLLGRCADTSNYYSARLTVTTAGLISLGLFKLVAAASTQIVSDVALGVMTAGDTWGIRLEVTGTTVRARTWNTTILEPSMWQCSVTDTALTSGTNIGVISRLETGNTNGTVVTTWDNVMCAGTLASSTTVTTGAYVRLSKTFTATQPKHVITVATVGAATACTVNIDAIQHEIGASATTFSTSGPVIYPYLRDYIERWPREWEAAGFVGIANTPAVDGFAALAAISIGTEVISAIQASNPQYYWLLAGGAETVSGQERMGSGVQLSRIISYYGAGNDVQFGTAMNIAGDSGGTGVTIGPPTGGGAGLSQAGTILGAGQTPNRTAGINFPGYLGNGTIDEWGYSIGCWVVIPPASTDLATLVWPFDPVGSPGLEPTPLQIFMSPGGIPSVFNVTPAGGFSVFLSPGPVINDGVPHFIVATFNQVATGNTTIKLYLDGVLLVTNTAVTTFNYPRNMQTIQVGGEFHSGETNGFIMTGQIGHVPLWNRVLTTAEILAIYTAGTGFTGEATGARLARHLSNGPYAGVTRISAGLTTLEPPTWANSIDLLSDAQALTLAEQGTLWVAPDGALVFEGRQDRWLRLTSVATFGEDTASGEIPYLDGVLFDYDPTFVYANVQVTRNNGSQVRGGTQAQINAVTRKYFGRPYAFGADFQTDVLAQYAADYIFNTHRAPSQRVSQIVIDPSSNPSIWPTALSLEVGQRVTVKRRAKAANSGAGITMSADYFIESVEHGEINMDTGVWLIGFLLSPIGSVGSGNGISFQPWILEDTTYGVLDSTTILGW